MLRIANTSPVSHLMNQDDVQSVVHDLRTPMTVIKGNLQLLLSGIMGELTGDQLMLVQRSVAPLEDLILMTENLLQAAALGQGGMTLKLEPTDLDKLLTDTIDFYSIPFKQRSMEIYRQGNTIGAKVKVDVFWMKRVLNNLIWNAYKFTPDNGRVVVEVKHVDDGLNISIEDNGRGIPEPKLKTIFQKFTQVQSGDHKMGSGLGLWICKKVLELHGGTIQAQSTEGHGTRFILHIPARCIL